MIGMADQFFQAIGGENKTDDEKLSFLEDWEEESYIQATSRHLVFREFREFKRHLVGMPNISQLVGHVAGAVY